MPRSSTSPQELQPITGILGRCASRLESGQVVQRSESVAELQAASRRGDEQEEEAGAINCHNAASPDLSERQHGDEAPFSRVQRKLNREKRRPRAVEQSERQYPLIRLHSVPKRGVFNKCTSHNRAIMCNSSRPGRTNLLHCHTANASPQSVKTALPGLFNPPPHEGDRRNGLHGPATPERKFQSRRAL